MSREDFIETQIQFFFAVIFFSRPMAGLAGRMPVLDDLRTGLGLFGIIEDMFARISAHIGKSVVDRGFLKAEQIVHYATHEMLDEEHV